MKLLILDSKNQSEFIYALESWDTKTLKEEIKKKYKISEEIELVYNGNILEDNDNLLAKGVTDGKTINFLGQFNAGKGFK